MALPRPDSQGAHKGRPPPRAILILQFGLKASLLGRVTVWFDIAKALERILEVTAAELNNFDDTFSAQVRPADPRFGDYQANGVLPFARSKQLNPRKLAETLRMALVDSGRLNPEVAEVSVAGPGFLNFKLQPPFLFRWLETFQTEDQLRNAAARRYQGRKIIVDYSSPNAAKQMHVGHVRSTVIGEAIKRMLSFSGAQVLGDNHIGDWGTGFGKLILAIKSTGYDLEAERENPLADLEALYRKGNQLAEESVDALEQARQELVKLQNDDVENQNYWEEIIRISQSGFHRIYRRLGVTFDHELGESFYRDKVERVYRELEETGVGQESEGAWAVFFPDHARFRQQPFLYRKSDGASNYASTDLATALYRVEAFAADEIIYVTDFRQRDHFEQLFLTLTVWFDKKDYKLPQLRHVWFGAILGNDRKPIKSRSGAPVLLDDLLNEAVERALRIVEEKNPHLPPGEKRDIAEAVGVGAVRYADLMQNRTSDYVFSWNKLLSLEGNTAPYLLYAVARIKSIFRKMEVAENAPLPHATPLQTKAEIELARKLTGFSYALEQALVDLKPHHLCAYLYELAGAFSAFYNADKVNVDELGPRQRRLMLCQRALLVLQTGLRLLGIRHLEKM